MAIDSNEVVGELRKLFLEEVTKAKKNDLNFHSQDQ